MKRPSAVLLAPLAVVFLTASQCDTRTGATTGASQKVGTTVVAQECRDGDGRKVQQLPDYLIKGISDPGVHTAGMTIAPVSIPDATVDGGCIIRYDAPPGCLGAVEITGATIPAVDLPGYEVPYGATRSAPGMSAAGTVLAGQKVEQACPPADNPTAVVYRGSVSRPSGYRPAVFRQGTKATQVCTGDNCAEAPAVASLMVAAVTIPAVTVEAEVTGGPAASPSGRTTPSPVRTGVVYVGSADVFFDVDAATIRPSAQLTLRNIADRLRKTHDSIRIEGHTDDTGSAEHNQQLSQARAEAVATWLKTSGGLANRRYTTIGYGETRPAVPNTSPANRQANRRVVISSD